MAAVVLPAASRASVRSRMSSPMAAISAMPPALSQMGPYASIARPARGSVQPQQGRHRLFARSPHNPVTQKVNGGMVVNPRAALL